MDEWADSFDETEGEETYTHTALIIALCAIY